MKVAFSTGLTCTEIHKAANLSRALEILFNQGSLPLYLEASNFPKKETTLKTQRPQIKLWSFESDRFNILATSVSHMSRKRIIFKEKNCIRTVFTCFTMYSRHGDA